jgi:hypothetical protein
MKFEIKARFTGCVIFEADIEASEDTPNSVRLGLAVMAAVKARAYLSRADLSGSNLSGAYLSGSNLSGAYLSGSNLSCANLSGSDLAGADLYGADLSRANLYGADLSGADLYGADLSGSNLSGAYLSRANLSGAKINRWVAQLRRSDGHEFIAFDTDQGVKIKAGCRWFTVPEYRAHVAKEYPDTPKAAETLAMLDFIEIRAAASQEIAK